MKFKVHMLAFKGPVKIREVEIDLKAYLKCESCQEVLDLIYKLGQNDFQPQQCYSVSAGDVIELPPRETGKDKLATPVDWVGGYWLVHAVGFRKRTQEEFDLLQANPEADNALSAYDL
jgi:hypothetical protein